MRVVVAWVGLGTFARTGRSVATAVRGRAAEAARAAAPPAAATSSARRGRGAGMDSGIEFPPSRVHDGRWARPRPAGRLTYASCHGAVSPDTALVHGAVQMGYR